MLGDCVCEQMTNPLLPIVLEHQSTLGQRSLQGSLLLSKHCRHTSPV